MVDLGLFPGGSVVRPRDIEPFGNVIVGQANGASGLFAFVWTPQLGLRKLHEHLQLRGIDVSNRTFTDCKGVGPQASSFCGAGTYFGSPFGFAARGLPCPTFSGVGGGTSNCPGGSISMTIGASGVGLSYQHYLNNVLLTNGVLSGGTVVSGATTPTVTFASIAAADFVPGTPVGTDDGRSGFRREARGNCSGVR
jgi:hypothetical protein